MKIRRCDKFSDDGNKDQATETNKTAARGHRSFPVCGVSAVGVFVASHNVLRFDVADADCGTQRTFEADLSADAPNDSCSATAMSGGPARYFCSLRPTV